MSQNTSPAPTTKLEVPFTVEPSTTADDVQRRRLARIKRAIRRKTSGGVRDLIIEVRGEELWLQGRCASFYCKQVAQTAAMNYLVGETLLNDIQVDARPR